MKRRTFLGSAAALGAGAAIDRVIGAGGTVPAQAAGAADAAAAPIAFEGAHQAGILTPAPPHAIFAAFDAIAPSRPELAMALQALSERARAARRAATTPCSGPRARARRQTPGILGPRVTPDGLTVTIAFGASLFGSRYGLAARKPRALKPMTTFPDDASSPRSATATCCVQLCANSEQTLLNALRDLMRATRGALAPRWKIEGFLPVSQGTGRAAQPARLQGRHREPCDRRPAPDGPRSCGPAHGDRGGPPAARTRCCASSATVSSSGTASRVLSRS